MGHPSTTCGWVDRRPDAAFGGLGPFSCLRSVSLVDLDMRKAAPHCQVPGRPHVLSHLQDGRNALIMAQPSYGITPFSPDVAALTAQAWYEEAAHMAATAVAVSDMAASLAEAADKLLGTATGVPKQREPQTLPEGVYDLSVYRARRAVTR